MYSFVRFSGKWLLGIVGCVLALFISFYGKPSVSNVVIHNNTTTSDILLNKEGQYYVPYVRSGGDEFVRGFDRCIDIQNINGFDVLDSGKLKSSSGNWFVSVPAKSNVLVLTEENMRAIRENPLSSIIDSSVKCIIGKKNGIWFKDMRVFVPINCDIDMISCRTNDSNRKIEFMSNGEKYFCLTISSDIIDMSGASIESIELLKDLDIIRERSYFYNIYSVIMDYLDFFIKSYGIIYGSLILIGIMLFISSYDIYMKVRRSELSQNKAIEIDIAQRQFANDSVRLNESLLSINNAYSEKDKNFLMYSLVFLIFEGYVNFGVVGDYFGVRGFMLGNNDLGLFELVNFSNFFGLFSNNPLASFVSFGPLSVIVAIIINTTTGQLSYGSNNSGMFVKILQMCLFVYMFSSKSVFFLLFYATYSIIKSLFVFALLKIRSRSPVKFVG